MAQTKKILGIKYIDWWKYFRLLFVFMHIWALVMIVTGNINRWLILILPITFMICIKFLNMFIEIEQEGQTLIEDFV